MLAVEKLPRWTDAAARGLGETVGEFGAELAQQVNRGVAELWRFDRHTYMITRLDRSQALGLELVVCCLRGRGLAEIAPRLIAAARRQGARSIRCHSSRPGMARMLARHGFRESERVYTLRLNS